MSLSVVFMDEPSTGLDPASRSSLWNVIKCAKQDCAIILTSISLSHAHKSLLSFLAAYMECSILGYDSASLLIMHLCQQASSFL